MNALRAIVAAGVLLVAGPAFGMAAGQCQCSMSVVSGAAGMTLTSGQARGPCGREMSLSKALAAGSAQTTAKAVGALAAETAAATKSVSVTDFQFSPTPVSITVGDTVTWSFNGGFHNVKTVAGAPETFSSPDLFSGTYSHTFTKAGTYNYYCSFHGSDNGNGTASGMAGRITVTAAPEPVGLALLPAAGLLWRRRR
jgi:plastocyanin